MALKNLVGRIGGKTKAKDNIIKNYFPDNYESMVYVEPFVGGGSIFFHKNPSVLEIINDIDLDIYIIFNGAKKYTHTAVADKLSRTYTKQEFIDIKKSKPTDDFDIFCRSFFLYSKSIMNCGRTFYEARAKMTVSLEGYKERLEDVEIYNVDYKELIAKYDSSETFFYLDPPYQNSTGLYKNDVVRTEELYNILKNIKGKFLMSYNNSENAKEIFSEYNIYEIPTTYSASPFGNKRILNDTNVVELLISNY